MLPMPAFNSRASRRGFTLVELLVVVAIISILVSLLLPAVQAARESARKINCASRLQQLAASLQQHWNAHETLPPGTVAAAGPISNVPQGLHHSWIIACLPYLDETVAFENVDPAISVYARPHQRVRDHSIELLTCPSFAGGTMSASNFAGCHAELETPIDADNAGVLYMNSRTTREAVTDGLRYTLLLGEKLIDSNDLGWMSGTRATLRNPGDFGEPENVPPPVDPLYVGSFGSHHVSGTQFAFCDGSINTLSTSIDSAILQALGHRHDGELLDHRDFQ